jgi:heat-inducible transcriptional repressor
MSSPVIPGRLRDSEPELSERQRRVFASLVALYLDEARPVSSERLRHAGGRGEPGGRLRRTLAELEEMGLLSRAHTAAGRLPSASGWEYFVRAVIEPAPVPAAVEDVVAERLSQARHDVERLLQEASRLLAMFTRQLGLALADSLEDEPLSALDLQPLGERRALLVLGLSGLRTRSLALELGTPLGRDALAEVTDVLRAALVGRPLAEARRRLADDAGLARHSAVRIVARAAVASWGRAVDTPLLSAGVAHMADQPEFADGSRLAPVLRVLESGGPLERLMVSGVRGHAGVRVGLAPESGLASMSLVSYPLPGAIPGAVAVLGPMRMDYAASLALVDLVGSRVADLLTA